MVEIPFASNWIASCYHMSHRILPVRIGFCQIAFSRLFMFPKSMWMHLMVLFAVSWSTISKIPIWLKFSEKPDSKFCKSWRICHGLVVLSIAICPYLPCLLFMQVTWTHRWAEGLLQRRTWLLPVFIWPTRGLWSFCWRPNSMSFLGFGLVRSPCQLHQIQCNFVGKKRAVFKTSETSIKKEIINPCLLETEACAQVALNFEGSLGPGRLAVWFPKKQLFKSSQMPLVSTSKII